MSRPRHNGRQVKQALQKVLADYDVAKAEAVGNVLVGALERMQSVAPKSTGRFAASIHMTTGDKPEIDLGGRGERWNLGRSAAQMNANKAEARKIVEGFRGKRQFGIKIFSGVYYGRWVEFGRRKRDGTMTKPHNTFRRGVTFLNSRLKKLGQEIRRP